MPRHYEELGQRYFAAVHAVQIAIAKALENDATDGTPSALRTDLDLLKANHDALVKLLMTKGIFDGTEYLTVLVNAVEAEQNRNEHD